MITDLFLSSVLISLLLFGLKRPSIALSAVLWVDLIKPQNLSYSFLAGKPLSLLVTGYFFIVFALNIKKIKMPSGMVYFLLLPLFGFWITIATFRAEFSDIAWIKYDVAIKTLIVVFFVPFVLKCRKDIELALFVCSLSFGMFISMAGLKTLLGGGGYGIALVGSNGFLYSEGSTLSTLSICLIPVFLYQFKYSLYSVSFPRIRYIFLAFIILSLLVLIGTQARTGLVALAMLVMMMFYQSKRKIRDIIVMITIGLSMIPFVTDGWVARMSTIDEGTTTEGSAVGRIVVWRWTIDYVSERPFFGGGFYSYHANGGLLHFYQKSGEVPIIQEGGKAFHNIFFEVLGESGYGGLLLFSMIIIHALLLNRRAKNESGDSDTWRHYLANALNMSLIIYCTGGLFIGVAFYPWLYYLYTFSVSLNNSQE